MSKIFSIVYQPKDKPYGTHIGDYIRDPLPRVTLIADHGIEGDVKAGKNRNRQLNLISLSWLEHLIPLGYRTEPGQFGEQIIVEDMEIDGLQPGDQLQIGGTAVIEITKPRTGCERLQAAQGLSRDPFNNLVGQLAKVIVGGEIQVGDEVIQVEAG